MPSKTSKQVAERVKAEGKSKPRAGRHPVNQPMVDHWLDAMGDKNPIYVDEAAAKAAGHPGVVAPPAMIQVWTMVGLGGERAPDDPLTKILGLFDDAGYIGVVATNCEQTYHRYLRPGEQVSVAAGCGPRTSGTAVPAAATPGWPVRSRARAVRRLRRCRRTILAAEFALARTRRSTASVYRRWLVLVAVANFAAIRCACFRTSTVTAFSITCEQT